MCNRQKLTFWDYLVFALLYQDVPKLGEHVSTLKKRIMISETKNAFLNTKTSSKWPGKLQWNSATKKKKKKKEVIYTVSSSFRVSKQPRSVFKNNSVSILPVS